MSYRFMRVIVFFDLPTETNEDKKNYRMFRKHLIRSGFLMLQESVYSKLALNSTAATAISENIKRHKPNNGLVSMLIITERQFSKMEFITGEYKTDIIDTDERLILL